MPVGGSIWSLFIQGWFCPIRLIHLILKKLEQLGLRMGACFGISIVLLLTFQNSALQDTYSKIRQTAASQHVK